MSKTKFPGIFQNGKKYSEEQIATAIKKSDGYKTQLASRLGCSWQTINNYFIRYPGLKKQLVAAKQARVDDAEYVITETIKNAAKKLKNGEEANKEELTICLKYLNYQGKDRGYGDNININNSGEIEYKVKIELVQPKKPLKVINQIDTKLIEDGT